MYVSVTLCAPDAGDMDQPAITTSKCIMCHSVTHSAGLVTDCAFDFTGCVHECRL